MGKKYKDIAGQIRMRLEGDVLFLAVIVEVLSQSCGKWV